MRGVQLLGAVLAAVASVFILRTVVHLYTEHGDLDLFHLFVAMAFAFAAVLLVRRVFVARGGEGSR